MLTGIITNVEQVAVAESISAVQSNMPSTTVKVRRRICNMQTKGIEGTETENLTKSILYTQQRVQLDPGWMENATFGCP